MTNEKLEKLGLSEKEASIYLSLLEIGPSMVSVIAKKAGVNRSTAYVVLEALTEKGLVSAAEQRSGRLYTSASPEKLILNLENMARQYSELANTARKLKPELKALSQKKKEQNQNTVKPNIQFFEGRAGIQSVYEDTLDSLEKIRAYAISEEPKNKTKEKTRVIFLDSLKARKEVMQTKKEARGAFISPQKGYSFSPEINIYDKKIVFISPTEKFALVVESAELASTLKQALDVAEKEKHNHDKNLSFFPKPSA